MDNVCRFIPMHPAPDVIQIINFVYEASGAINSVAPKISAVYRIHYVTEGSATVQCGSLRCRVKAGDIFFILPGVPYVIEGDGELKYYYISYLGLRANILSERLGISSRNFVFEGFFDVLNIWEQGVAVSDKNIDLAGESVLMYTFSRIGERANTEKEQIFSAVSNRFLLVKKYIDDNFSDCDFSLEKLSREFSYNKKYLSNAFKKQYKIGIVEYVNTVRINHACILMDQNYTSVSDVAYLCGYADPMYFSRIFKLKMKMSPTEYMRKNKNNI